MKQNILNGLRNELLSRGSFDTFPDHIWKTASSLNTYGTNAIEGNTLTQDEVDKVIIDRTGVKRPINDILVTIQHESAFRNLIERRRRSIDLVTILELHEEVFKGLLEDAGQWRRTNVMVRGASFTPPRPEKVVQILEMMFKEYDQRDMVGENAFSLGAWLHHRFECTHPFNDGNGRVGRLIMNLHFLKHNWPPVNILPEDRERYLNALNEGNNGNVQPLTDHLKIIMGGSLLNFLAPVGTEKDELRPLIKFQGSDYSAKYMSLRARQGELPAVRIRNEWNTTQRALDLYIDEVGKK